MELQLPSRYNDCVPGHVMEGRVLSTLLTVKLQELVLPFPSLASRVTLKAPTPLTEDPAEGDWVTVTVEAQLSDAAARPV